jgi:hypothetical protein
LNYYRYIRVLTAKLYGAIANCKYWKKYL